MSEIMTKKEVAELLRCSPRTIDRMVAEARLKAIRIGGMVRFRHEDVQRTIQDARQ